jgi:hypothetical protein
VPPEICSRIEALWDGTTLAKFPDRIVSEFSPHRAFAEALGPAVRFWQEAGLACWYVCEGRHSRTTLPFLSRHLSEHRGALEDTGYPVDPQLFRDLKAAEAQLGPIEEITETSQLGGGLTMSFVRGRRRDGWEILRDILTRYRRAWTADHLDAYLANRWESELRAVAREFNRMTAARAGKPPTIRQFAGFARDAANHWFGGDLARLYAGIGEVAALSPQRIDLLAGDPIAFVSHVYQLLGGAPTLTEEQALDDEPARSRQYRLERLATRATRYLQIYEALGRPPTANEFSAKHLPWDDLGGLEAGWSRYVDAIETARKIGPATATGTGAPPQGWYPDPAGRFQRRWWDGATWTAQVITAGRRTDDPLS